MSLKEQSIDLTDIERFQKQGIRSDAQTLLGKVIDEENPEESPSEVELSTQEQEARLSARRTDLISACFTSCRCISEPCACVLDDCTP